MNDLPLKRALDLALILLALPVLVPVLFLLAAAVALTSSGPVLVRQIRVGRGGRPFLLRKFRTMRANAEPGGRPAWPRNDDPRATRLGRWLRPAGLDELPQLWNVLAGEMSLVGPRPERPAFHRRFARHVPGWTERLRVPPGITGWAQVHGLRGDASVAARARLDRWYARRRSLALDLAILARTAALPFRRRGR